MSRGVAGLAAATLILAGCAGSDSAPKTTKTATAATAAPGAAKPGQPAPAKLRTALLTEADLGAGWAEVSLPLQGAKLCGIVPLKADGTTKVRAEFARVNGGAVVQHGLTAYPDGGATTVLGALRAATTGCTTYRVSAPASGDAAARDYEVAVAPVKLPAVGDERVGLRLALVDGTRKQATLYGVARRDDLIAAVTVTGAQPDPALFARLLTLADRRLLVLAGG